MYNGFYNLRVSPFENTADPRFFFASEQHREALSAIEYTIRMRKGVVLITGAIGSGKTTVGGMMCANCNGKATIIQIVPRNCTGVDLLRQVLRQQGLKVDQDQDYATMVERLAAHLNDRASRKRPVVLFVDEAQSLDDDALEELRMLSNLNTANQKLIQVVLIGQPELRQRLRQPQYDALRQRIVLAKQIRPLDHDETGSYITHRLTTASCDPGRPGVTFSPGAVREIHRLTGGVPRLINVACDNCLLLGFVRELKQITPEVVHQVIQDMVPRFNDEAQPDTEASSTFILAGNF